MANLESLGINVKAIRGTREVTIGSYEYGRLEERAQELGVEPREILEWLIEECMDEFEL